MIFQGRSPWRRNARTTRCMQMWRSQTKKHMGCSRVLLDHRIGWWENFNRKALYLMVKTHGFPVNFPLNQSSDWKNLCAISCLETASCFYWHVRIRNNFAHGILVFWETFRKTSRKSWGALRPLDSFRKNIVCGGKKETIADATSSLWHSSMLPARGQFSRSARS